MKQMVEAGRDRKCMDGSGYKWVVVDGMGKRRVEAIHRWRWVELR